MSRALELLILLAACGATFFTGLARHDYIKTEGLRAVVVEEMLERDGLTMPTVHGAPYLKKPPLYAWTTTLLARAAGRFDEQIARLPSAICGTLLVLLVYGLGERWIGRRAGFCAAVLLLWCPTVVDYSARAELDMPFSFFCIAAIACTLRALDNEARPAAWAWPAAYLLALIAALWKGPHSLIFLWLVMIGHGLATRRWGFLRSPIQWISLALVLGVLIWWAKALSEFAGPARVGRTAAIELVARLLPHRPIHFAFIIMFPFELAAMTAIPAAFALFTLHPDARRAFGFGGDEQVPAGAPLRRASILLRDWWTSLTRNPQLRNIAIWFVPLLVFMAIAPAKAARYSIPIFPPIVLLAAAICTGLQNEQQDVAISRAYHRVWRIVFAALGIVGAAALGRWIAGLTVGPVLFAESDRGFRWLILAIGCIAVASIELLARHNASLSQRLVRLVFVLLAAQPMMQFELWPRREAGDSQRNAAQKLDEAVPANKTIYILGKHEFPDTQIYSQRDFRFADSIDAALTRAGGDRAFCIVRIDDLDETTAGEVARHREVLRFLRAEKENLLIEVTPK